VIIDKMLAWNECFTLLRKHVSIKHPEVLAEIQVELEKYITSLTAYVTITSMSKPADDEYINLLTEEFQKEIMFAAGFEAEEQNQDQEQEPDEEQEKEGEQPEDKPAEDDKPDDAAIETDNVHKIAS
jgi:hypothetical protein